MNNIKLQHFRDAMQNFNEDYILIGGNACALLFDSVGAVFRETADLDIVLVIENWSDDFASALDDYIEKGEYRGRRFTRGDHDGNRHVHRFNIDSNNPKFDQLPSQIELFSRCPDGITLRADQHLVPVEAGDGVSNFSAILLDDEYYAYLNENIICLEGIRIPDRKCLTALKASAWINNRALFLKGILSDIGTVYKHAFDICRLFAIYEDQHFETSKIPSRVFDDLMHAKTLFSDQQETKKLDQFLALTTTSLLPVSYVDASEYLITVFEV